MVPWQGKTCGEADPILWGPTAQVRGLKLEHQLLLLLFHKQLTGFVNSQQNLWSFSCALFPHDFPCTSVLEF